MISGEPELSLQPKGVGEYFDFWVGELKKMSENDKEESAKKSAAADLVKKMETLKVNMKIENFQAASPYLIMSAVKSQIEIADEEMNKIKGEIGTELRGLSVSEQKRELLGLVRVGLEERGVEFPNK